MQNEFLQKCDELTSKLNKLEVSRTVSLEQIKICSEELKELIAKLNSLDIPIVNGEKVISLTIDETKLGNYMYIHDLNSKLPLILSKLEEIGINLINQVNI